MHINRYLIVIIILETVIIGFLLPYAILAKTITAYWSPTSSFIVALSGPLVAGLVIWFLGEHVSSVRIKQDAIRDLMTHRGDYANPLFRQSLNKVAIVFHNDSEIRQEVRHLYEVVNNPSLRGNITNRTIVGLLYKLCQRNGFKGLTEYDIDQSFLDPESQTPISIENPGADDIPAIEKSPKSNVKKRSTPVSPNKKTKQ